MCIFFSGISLTSLGSPSRLSVTPRVLIGEVYKYLGEKLEFLWVLRTLQPTSMLLVANLKLRR